LIQSCKLNGVELLAYLTDVLQRIVSEQTKNLQLHALLPWNWRPPATVAAA
jgi:transposase